MHAKVASLIAVLAWLATGALPTAFAGDRLSLTGSSTVAPLALEIARRFEAHRPGTRIDVQTGGSTRGIIDARSGLADIGLVSRDLLPEERNLVAHVIAWDGIGILLHADNPVRSLSREQLRAIYTGEITRWHEVGGRDERITVVNKAEGRSTLTLFLDYLGLRNSALKPQVIIGDNQQGIKTVAGNRGAIGYVSIGAAEFDTTRGTPIRLLPLEGVPATVAAVREGHYPLARPLNLVTRGEATGLARRFLEFAQSEAVDDLIEAQFFVPPTR
jgi:phosphate transport system substrate-binding protein